MHQPVMTLFDGRMVAALLVFSLFVTSCRPEGSTSQRVKSMDASSAVTVFAAASMNDAIEDIAARFRKTDSGSVDVSLGASNQLAMQVMQGAPADIFISASVDWADKLRDSGLTQADRRFVGNRLAIVAPRDGVATKIFTEPNTAGEREESLGERKDSLCADWQLRQLLHPSINLVALAEESVPAGKYAEEALTKAGVFAGLQLNHRIVRGGDVRIVLSYVASGNVDAGIVYFSDAHASTNVELLCLVEKDLHAPIRYPMMLLKRGGSNLRARRFFEFLGSEEARAVFRACGFTILDET